MYRVGRLLRLYRRLEAGAHYHWRYGLLVAVALAAPLAAGRAAGNVHGGVVAALAAWFVALAVPPRSARGRAAFLGRRWLVVTATTALGTLCAPSPVATAAVMTLLGLAVPVPGVTITAVITFVMGLDTPPGMTAAQHVACFAAGGLWAVLLLLHPWAGSPVAPPRPPLQVAHLGRRALAHLRSRTSQARYAGQVGATLPTVFLALHAVHWPHPGWVLVPPVPAWGETTEGSYCVGSGGGEN